MPGFPQERNWTMPAWPAPWGVQQGPPPPGVVYPAAPSPEARAAMVSHQQLAEETARGVIWNSQVTPLQDPPYRGQPLVPEVRAVLAPIPGNAAAMAAAVALAAAEAPYSGGLPLLLPATVNTWVDVLTYAVPRSSRAVLRQVGFGAPLAPKDAIRWRVVVGGLPLALGNPNGGYFPRSSMDDLLDTFAVPMGGQTITIQARNLNPNSGYLVEARLYGWVFPTLQQDDTLRSLLGTNGLQTNGRFSETAFAPPICPPSLACPPPPDCPPCGPTSCA